MSLTAEQVVIKWLGELGMDLRPYESTILYQKWYDKGWRFYLYKNLDFAGYSIHRCSYIKVSLTHPESINKIEAWLKENKA